MYYIQRRRIHLSGFSYICPSFNAHQVMDYIKFVKEYRDLACRYADAAICRHVQKHGALNSRIDVDLVKDLAVETALSKVFYNYDPERAKKANAQFSTFLNKVVNNCVLNELTSEVRALNR